MFQRVLVLCTGNICRSPMAEALLRERLKAGSIEVGSAGIAALVGEPADPHAIVVMREHGIDITAHRGRQATEPLMAHHDLILTMDRIHFDWIKQRYPHLHGRTHPLGRWRKKEILDPYGRPLGAFEDTYDLIEACVGDWVPRIGAATRPV